MSHNILFSQALIPTNQNYSIVTTCANVNKKGSPGLSWITCKASIVSLFYDWMERLYAWQPRHRYNVVVLLLLCKRCIWKVLSILPCWVMALHIVYSSINSPVGASTYSHEPMDGVFTASRTVSPLTHSKTKRKARASQCCFFALLVSFEHHCNSGSVIFFEYV